LEASQETTAGGLSPAGRIAVAAAGVLVVALVAALLLGQGGGYKVNARFIAAPQVVKGGLVQIGGRPVGTVEKIELTEDGQAQLELALDDEFGPLARGTEAKVRLASLSSPTGRYVELLPPPTTSDRRETIPDGGVIPASQTTAAIDLDQFFNLFDRRTRQGLRRVYRGFADFYGGQGAAQNAGWRYLNPSLVGAQRLFRELSHDTPVLERFLVETSRLVGDLASRRDSLAAVVDNLATTLGAIAREEVDLSSAVQRLAPFMRRANTTLANLRTTLDDLDPLVREATPVAPKLRRVLAQLRPFAIEAVPTVRDLSALVRRPGAHNDLLELSRAIPPFRDQAIGPLQRNGEQRPGSFETSTRSFSGQTPALAYFRPYSVDLTGWFDDFSHSGIYDANGSASRNALNVNAYQLVSGQLQPVPPELRDELFTLTARRGQNQRCPGSVERNPGDGSTPYRPSPEFPCDPTQIPPGR
jgi:phospholipid/cholesterol/gamma-HCH transport system substrate-binding protein